MILTIAAMMLVTSIATVDAGEVRLIVRGDDLGMTQGSLVTFEGAFNQLPRVMD